MKKRSDLVYPELSYKIVGCLYSVHNVLGGGLREKAYEAALKEAFKKSALKYICQNKIAINYNGKKVADRFVDFLIEDKVILEIKSGERFTVEFLKQISEYLKESGLRLGLLANFGRDRVTIKRVVNADS